MPIKRNSCRVSERKRMREMHAQGYAVPQISNAVSVREHIVAQVVDGSWAEQEKQGKLQQRANDAARSTAEQDAKAQEAATLGAAIAGALKGEVDTRSRQQKAADTRRANKEAEEGGEHAA